VTWDVHNPQEKKTQNQTQTHLRNNRTAAAWDPPVCAVLVIFGLRPTFIKILVMRLTEGHACPYFSYHNTAPMYSLVAVLLFFVVQGNGGKRERRRGGGINILLLLHNQSPQKGKE
jgi:hypothetical protein